jgi:hypothetical protein
MALLVAATWLMSACSAQHEGDYLRLHACDNADDAQLYELHSEVGMHTQLSPLRVGTMHAYAPDASCMSTCTVARCNRCSEVTTSEQTHVRTGHIYLNLICGCFWNPLAVIQSVRSHTSQSHHTAPHRTTPLTPHRTTPTPHRTIPHCTAPHHTTPHHTTPHRTAPYHTTPHHTTPPTPHRTTPAPSPLTLCVTPPRFSPSGALRRSQLDRSEAIKRPDAVRGRMHVVRLCYVWRQRTPRAPEVRPWVQRAGVVPHSSHQLGPRERHCADQPRFPPVGEVRRVEHMPHGLGESTPHTTPRSRPVLSICTCPVSCTQ